MTEAAVHQLYLIATAACAVLGAVGLLIRLRPRRPSGFWVVPGTLLALLISAVFGLRFSVAGHLPLFGTYESGLSLAAAVLWASWLWEWRAGFRLGAGPWAALVAAAVLTHASTFDPTVYALTISERSWVVDAHALFAWATFGVLAVNLGCSLREVLAKVRDEARSRLIVSTLELGFVLHTGLMITGSFYKFLLFGKAWSFDPIETMGLTAWLSYGTLIHQTRFAGWTGRRLAGFCIFLFVLLAASYRLIVYFPAWSTYHILDMDLRLHLPG